MLPSTQYYKDHVLDHSQRYRVKAVIDWSNYNTDSDTLTTVTTNDDRISFPKQISDGLTSPSYRYWSWGNFKWGESHLMDEQEQRFQHGAISDQLSGSDGSFTTPPTFKTEFSPRSIFGLSVSFDDKLLEYAPSFTIEARGEDAAIIKTVNVTNNSGVKWEMDLEGTGEQLTDIESLTLTINSWSRPNSKARVLEFFTGIQLEYTEREIIDLSVFEESDPTGATSPIGNLTSNTASLSLANIDEEFEDDNPDSVLQSQIVPNRRVSLFIGIDGDNDESGDPIFHPLGVYYTKEWDIDSGEQIASVTCQDVISLMDETEYTNDVLIEPGDSQVIFYRGLQDAWVDWELNNLKVVTTNQFITALAIGEIGGEKRSFSVGRISGVFGNGLFGKTLFTRKSFIGEGEVDIEATGYKEGQSIVVSIETIISGIGLGDNEEIQFSYSIDGEQFKNIPRDSFGVYIFSFIPEIKTSSSHTIKIRMVFLTPDLNTPTRIEGVNFRIFKPVTSRSLITKVLDDFNDDSDGILDNKYRISEDLGSIITVNESGQRSISQENAFLPRGTHREVLRTILEAASARAFVTRDGYIKVEPVNAPSPDESIYRDKSSSFSFNNPVNPSDVINLVKVEVQPFILTETLESVAKVTKDNTIPAKETVNFEILFKKTISTSGVKDSITNPDDLPSSYNTANFTINYSYKDGSTTRNLLPPDITETRRVVTTNGVSIELKSNDTATNDYVVNIDVMSYAFNKESEAVIVEGENNLSRRRFGTKELIIKNNLIKTSPEALSIVNSLLSSLKEQRRNLEASIVPDVTTEIGDLIITHRGEYVIKSQQIDYNETGLTHTVGGVKI